MSEPSSKMNSGGHFSPRLFKCAANNHEFRNYFNRQSLTINLELPFMPNIFNARHRFLGTVACQYKIVYAEAD
jgi:hypothetical protein